MRYEESRVIKHTPKNLFNLVSDVSKYPEFLPWCLGARVKNIKQNNFMIGIVMLGHYHTVLLIQSYT